jgi:Zn finger protein HypA/HybF involved in hydrogenase expression
MVRRINKIEGGEEPGLYQVMAMVIELSTAFAMRCPTCGRLDIDQLNIFQFSGSGARDIYCECGTRKASIQKKGTSYISIRYYCIICDSEHNCILPKRVFWSRKQLNSLACLDTDLNLGYFGSYRLIKKELDRQQEELNSMANELGFDEFVNPEIMLEVLDYLHDIAADGGLYCECGSHDINIELYSDKLELSCNKCHSIRQILASKQDDLDNLKKTDEVIIKLATGRSKNF